MSGHGRRADAGAIKSQRELPRRRVPFDEQLRVFVDEHRSMLDSCLDGVSETEARHRLVQSKTTLLGLVKHATFVERVWFEKRSRAGLVPGQESSPARTIHVTSWTTTPLPPSRRNTGTCAKHRVTGSGP
jgi:hypothetical protein